MHSASKNFYREKIIETVLVYKIDSFTHSPLEYEEFISVKEC